MHEADLIGVHEAGIAHHVAAVGQIDGEDRAAAVGNGAGAMFVQLLVVVRTDVAAGEDVFQVLEEGGVDGHHIFEVAVNRAILDHEDLAIALDDLRFDLAGLVGVENFERLLAVENLLPDLRDALRAQRIGCAGPAQGRLHLFPGLEERFFRPIRNEAGILPDLIEFIEDHPSRSGGSRQNFLGILDWLVHVVLVLLVQVPSVTIP